MCVRAETLPDCTGVAGTLAVCMGVEQMQSNCTGAAETLPNRDIILGTLPFT